METEEENSETSKRKNIGSKGEIVRYLRLEVKKKKVKGPTFERIIYLLNKKLKIPATQLIQASKLTELEKIKRVVSLRTK